MSIYVPNDGILTGVQTPLLPLFVDPCYICLGNFEIEASHWIRQLKIMHIHAFAARSVVADKLHKSRSKLNLSKIM